MLPVALLALTVSALPTENGTEIINSSIYRAPNDTNFLNRQLLLNLLSNCKTNN
jgi:hypothetical protein